MTPRKVWIPITLIAILALGGCASRRTQLEAKATLQYWETLDALVIATAMKSPGLGAYKNHLTIGAEDLSGSSGLLPIGFLLNSEYKRETVRVEGTTGVAFVEIATRRRGHGPWKLKELKLHPTAENERFERAYEQRIRSSAARNLEELSK